MTSREPSPRRSGSARRRVIVVSSRLMNLRQAQLLDFAAKNKIPLVTGWGSWVQNGALFSYGPNIDEIVRRSVTHVDKILRGARPGDIPIEQPTRFELVVSVKTARALNLTVPAVAPRARGPRRRIAGRRLTARRSAFSTTSGVMG